VSEQGRGRAPYLGEGSPGPREAEGEGGEAFYMDQTGNRPDLLASTPRRGGGEGGNARAGTEFLESKVMPTSSHRLMLTLLHRMWLAVPTCFLPS